MAVVEDCTVYRCGAPSASNESIWLRIIGAGMNFGYGGKNTLQVKVGPGSAPKFIVPKEPPNPIYVDNFTNSFHTSPKSGSKFQRCWPSTVQPMSWVRGWVLVPETRCQLITPWKPYRGTDTNFGYGGKNTFSAPKIYCAQRAPRSNIRG
jgi:hypothetical protein